jgi:hypothetical protein
MRRWSSGLIRARTLERRTVCNGVAPDRDEAAAAVSDALDELPR